MRTVEKIAFVETVYLLLQVYGMGMTFGRRRESRFVFGLVSSQNEQVGDAQKVQVYQCVFGFTLGKPAANEVRNGRNTVFVLYGGGHGDRSRTAFFRYPLVEAVIGSFVDKLAAVRCDIDVLRVEFA